ncbi:MAG: 6-hydroxymethylpterin diphosphokinase MptE-like protein [Phycisphaerales bacterium]
MGERAMDIEWSESTFRANAAALSRRNPWLATALEACGPRTGLVFEPSEESSGALAATLDGRALASKRRPLEEARRWAESVDLDGNAVAVVHGFGLGHHVAALGERCDPLSAIVVVEPDLALLRAVFGRIDHSEWLERCEVRFAPSSGEVGTLVSCLRGLEAALGSGVCIVVHPPSAKRLAPDIAAFNEAFPAAVATVRTHIVTTLMQSDTTFRNALANAEVYARSEGIAPLKGCAGGRLGVVVSAGPSLKRNVELLRDPEFRARCVVVAVQTVLKPLLALGIRPDFVTAIDYAEISARFYEGLTSEDVEGVTLVATARSNPAIHNAWPGRRRVIHEDILDLALGAELAGSPDGRARGTLPPAATVAHLAYALARHMGCDPVALIGQDLAFTDGQYYADGAAIHTTWGAEINGFRTLEMMEWERIVRMRSHLYRKQDQLGRPVYADEQMATYAAQFEQLFAADAQRGLRTIDATEGGIAKRHTESMALLEALEAHAGDDAAPIAPFPLALDHACPERRERVRERLAALRTGVRRIVRLSRQTEELLARITRHADDVPRINRLVDEVHRIRDEVHTIEPAWTLLQRLNQTAAMKRFAADRRIARAVDADERERMALRIERDIVNVRWMAEVGDYFDQMLARIDDSFDGAPALTREVVAASDTEGGESAGGGARCAPRCWAVLVDGPGLCDGGSWARALAPGSPPPLKLLVDRLARSTRVRGIAILTTRTEEAQRVLGTPPSGIDLRVVHIPKPSEGEDACRRAVRTARLGAAASWRGGVGNLTVFDESFDAGRIVAALTEAGLLDAIDAALIAGMDWCLLDPVLVDRMIEQHEECPEQFGIVISQALPGLSPVLLSQKNLREFAGGQGDNAVFSNLGGTLGYVPVRPRPDPIGRANCIRIDGPARDGGIRLIPDTRRGREGVRGALERLGDRVVEADADACARAAIGALGVLPPGELVVNAAPPARCAGVMGGWFDATPVGVPGAVQGISCEALRRVLSDMGDAAHSVVLTIGLTGWRGWGSVCPGDGLRPADPLDTDDWRSLVEAARAQGVGAVHVRTDLSRAGDAHRLIDAGVDIVSVDAWANDAALYERLTGRDAMRVVFENLHTMLEGREVARGLPIPWVVPRITRCDETYEAIEAFYDKWLILAGAAAIDPLPSPRCGERIAPLTLPAFVDRRLCSERMVVLGDGAVARDDGAMALVESPARMLDRWGQLVRERDWRDGQSEQGAHEGATGRSPARASACGTEAA